MPEVPEVGEVTVRFRNSIWRVFSDSMNKCGAVYSFGNSSRTMYWIDFLASYKEQVLIISYDSQPPFNLPAVKTWLRQIIIERESHEVITLCEHMLRVDGIPDELKGCIEECFKNHSLCHVDRSAEPVRVVSCSSKEMRESVKQSLGNINKSELVGTITHLRSAAINLNDGKFADSIRDSIHAVETAAKKIDPAASKNLTSALDSLEKHKLIGHPALKEAFKKLYGYTSDKAGIRHALVDNAESKAGLDEAMFMYGACVSFVDYLVSKQKALATQRLAKK